MPKLPESMTKVTTFSKIVALILFVSLPFIGFYLGVIYQKNMTVEDEYVERDDGKTQNNVDQTEIDDSEDKKNVEPTTAKLDELLDTSSWTLYKNEEMRFEIKYPEIIKDINLALMERKNENIDKVNCIDIGPVQGESIAKISIGYEPTDGSPDLCFRSSVGTGKLVEEKVMIKIGDKEYEAIKSSYQGDATDKSYVNYFIKLDNPNMDKSQYNYFAVQLEYYPEYEQQYLDLYLDILSTFEWL